MIDTKQWIELLQKKNKIIEKKDDVIATLEKVIIKLQRFPFEPICLLCGRLEPCMTDEEGIKNGGPGRPCTFDPTPMELFKENERLRKENFALTAKQCIVKGGLVEDELMGGTSYCTIKERYEQQCKSTKKCIENITNLERMLRESRED